jgi:excisionase family DNA binding protein
MKNKWLSVDEAAEYLGVKRDTIYRWIKNHNLPTYKVGRLWKFKAEELDAWVKSGGTGKSWGGMK